MLCCTLLYAHSSFAIILMGPGFNFLAGFKGWAQKGKIQFFRSWSCCKSNKGNDTCRNMVAQNLPTVPPPRPGVGSKGLNFIFSEYGHVAYQIKRD